MYERLDDKGHEDEQAELLVTSGIKLPGEGENQLHRELDCGSDVTSESVKDHRVVQRRVQVLLVVFWSSREPRTL